MSLPPSATLPPDAPRPAEARPPSAPQPLPASPRPPSSPRRGAPRPRSRAARLGAWLLAGIALFAALSAAGAERWPGRLAALAQGRETRYLPATLREAPLGPDQPTQPNPTPTGSATALPTQSPGEPTLPPPYPVPWPPPGGPDALAETLALLGTDASAMGYRPKGDWTRFPLPGRTDYLLPMFEPLYAEPLRIYDAARTMGNAADRWLHPYAVKDANLFRAPYYLGLDRMVGNFRDYSANVLVEPAAADPLRQAVRDLYGYAREDLAHFSFGFAVPSAAEEVMARDLAALPAPLQRAVARMLVNQLDAIRWRDRGLRRLPPELARQAFAIRDLGDTQGDGAFYYPQIDDVMRDLDRPSLFYAGLKAVEAAQQLRLELDRLPEAERCGARMVDIPTPFGRVLVGTCGSDVYQGEDILLSVDPGGDDAHRDNAGGTAAIEMPVAVAVDRSGDDVWDCAGMARGACQGAGILGAGVLVDAVGADQYRAPHNAQGLGYLGLGLLFDGAGRDRYEARNSAQGAGFFGYGALLEGSGDDEYRLFFDGQGYGGVGGGVGVLADREGDDLYHAEPDVRNLPPELQYRNYAGNGQPNTVVSFAQGAAAGRRGDGSDGHSWPGGLGAVVDVLGDDRYQAGAFAQGYGYWYGIGLIHEGSGDDRYESVYYSIASGAHYSASAIVDEAGNDAYIQQQTIPGSTAGAGVAFAWDFVSALIFDRSGDDRYESRVNCLGRSAEKGNAYLIDGGGDDRYTVGANPDGSGRADCLGSSGWRPLFGADSFRPYLTGYESGVFSLLLDLGGSDAYLAKNFGTGDSLPHQAAAEGRTWYNPNPDEPAPGVPGLSYRQASFFGLGIDRADGRIPQFDRIPPAATPAPTAAAGSGALPDALPAEPPDFFPGGDPWFRAPDRGGAPNLSAAPTAGPGAVRGR